MRWLRRVYDQPKPWERYVIWFGMAMGASVLLGPLSWVQLAGLMVYAMAFSWFLSRAARWRNRKALPPDKDWVTFTCSCGFSGRVTGAWEKHPDMVRLVFATQDAHSGPGHKLVWDYDGPAKA